MQILVISDKIPASRLGDGLRLFGLLRPLVQRHRFDLLCFARSGDQLEPAANDLFSTVRTLPFPASRAPSLAHKITGALRLRNFKASSAEMRAAIGAAVSTEKYDVVLDVSANMLLSLPEGPMPVPLVVDSMDEPLLRDFRALRHLPVGCWPRLLRQILMYWRYERAMLGRATINVYASELDAEVYRRFFPGRRVAFVPNGVDLDFFRLRGSGGERDADRLIVFEGNMMFPPNVDAARRLCTEILPRIRMNGASPRVCLVGRDPAPEVRALKGPDVEVTGTVSDIRPYLEKAAVFACPMTLGSGIKNKILQAWAVGLPVVASPQSLGGLPARDGVNILVRDTPSAFADGVLELLGNRTRAQALGLEGRRTVERHFSWESCSKAFEDVLTEAHTTFGRTQSNA